MSTQPLPGRVSSPARQAARTWLTRTKPPPREPQRDERPVSFRTRTNLVLFVLTVFSVFFVGQTWTAREGVGGIQRLLEAWPFAVPLLFILVCHELGHYLAARIHRVPASLPYFLPLPILNPFGTLGAIILMPQRIRSRRALLDIGAAGPLAGMVVALPLMLYGLSLSKIGPRSAENYYQEGQSLLYWALKSLVFGPIPAGQDVYLHPTAFAAWAGFLLTFLNVLPFGQLDGGHVAYALLGSRQNRIARWIPFMPLALAVYNFVIYVLPIIQRGWSEGFGELGWHAFLPVGAVTLWLTLWVLLVALRRVAGSDHPPVDDHEMGTGRKAIAVFTLVLFVLLFTPTPLMVF